MFTTYILFSVES